MRFTSLCAGALRIVAASIFVVPMTLQAAEPAPAELQPAREAVLRHVQEHSIPGLSVAVWKDGRII
ncbi:MAG: hypothetical protein JNL55_35545, partial [Steroidobacter sp.]